MITPLLKTALEPIAEQQRRLRLMRQLTIFWAVIALVGVALLIAKVNPLLCFALLVAAALVGALFIRAKAREWEPDWRGVARRVEDQHPDLHSLLLTAVEQSPDAHTRQLNYLQQRVIAEAVRQSRLHNWLDVVPASRSAMALALQAAAFAALLAVIGTAFLQRRAAVSHPTAQNSESPVVARDGVEVTPGDAELERGSGLVVLATFRHDKLPSEATLVIQPQNQPERRLPLSKNLNDPAFGGALAEVDANMTYRVEYAGQATRDFKVKVFEHPRLDRADATLHYPTYTKLPEKTVPDTRRVTAVEGTKLDVAFQLNKAVKSAALVSKDGKEEVPLTVEAGKAAASLRGFDVKTSQNYELRLVDADGRTSKTPAQFAINAVPNRRPELKFLTPKGDQRVSPIEEVAFRAQAWDDFGLVRYGVTVNVGGKGEKEVELGKDSRPDERREMSHLLKLEDAGVKPDELLSWYVWAEDIGPDGQPRRTATDMFFGEVRPFEEIFRQADGAQAEQQQQQQQQGQQGGDQATKLADLQKQVITATWNLKRGEDAQPKTPSEKYLKDLPAVRDGQGDALQQAGALNEQAGDNPRTRALVEDVTKKMQAALDRLKASEKTPVPLPEALAAEQAAYSALLKLAAHEFNVARSRQNQQRQAGGGGQQDRQRQQLDQLELKDEKQRYETKSEAAKPQNEQQRNQLATINRLKELAQRQQDINERLKELQTALQSAKTEPEKEEARRQLKRLREEEQQMLADMDETRQQMEQASNQGQMAEDRQRLDETRNEAQQASEAMERGAASQALASGSRTQQQLQQMRDDLRKKTSGQFNEDMRQMRTEARELAQNQQDIANQLAAGPTAPKPERRSLDGASDREKISEQLRKQQAQLASITEQMKRVSEQAETAEPLLSKELYDTLRQTAQAATDQKLQRTQLLAERGYPAQAQQFEQKAREEIESLKDGVERAAESVLGNEGEALRQARAELDALNDQLAREIAQARPDLAANDANRRQRQQQAERDGQPQAGQPGGQDGALDAAGQPQPMQSGNERNAGQARRPGQPRGANGQPGERNPFAQGQRGNEPSQPQNQTAQNGQRGQSGQPEQAGAQPGQPDQQPGQQPQNALAQGQGQRNRRAGQQPGGQQNPNGEPGQQPGDQQAQNGEADPSSQPDQQTPNGQPGSGRNGRAQQARNRPPNNGGQPQPGGDPSQSDSAQQAQNQEQTQPDQNQEGQGQGNQPGQRQGQSQQQLARNGQQRGPGQRGGGQGQGQPQQGQGQQGGDGSPQQSPGDEQAQNDQNAAQDPSAQTAQARGGRGGGNGANPANNNSNSSNNADDQNPASPDDAQRRERLAQLLDANSPARRAQRNGARNNNSARNNNGGGNNGGGGGEQYDGGAWNGRNGDYTRPLTGEDFVQWSDRLRNVEEMLDAPELRNETSRIRELARGVRVDYKRNNAAPDWDMVRNKISQPLAELRDRLTQELARRESKENLVPIDRDPVPNKYAEGVRRYYEELGLSR